MRVETFFGPLDLYVVAVDGNYIVLCAPDDEGLDELASCHDDALDTLELALVNMPVGHSLLLDGSYIARKDADGYLCWAQIMQPHGSMPPTVEAAGAALDLIMKWEC